MIDDTRFRLAIVRVETGVNFYVAIRGRERFERERDYLLKMTRQQLEPNEIMFAVTDDQLDAYRTFQDEMDQIYGDPSGS